MRRTMLATPVVALLSGFTGVLLAGCAADTGDGGDCGAGSGNRVGGAGFAEVLALPAPTADYAWYPGTVTDALPSVRYTGDGADGAHASELAAVGRFTGWEPGEPAHPSLQQIDLTFEVDEVIDSLGDLTMLEGGTVTWPVADSIAANNPADAHPEADADTLDELRDAATEERTVDVSTE